VNQAWYVVEGIIIDINLYISLLISLETMLALFENLWCSFLQFTYTVYTNSYYEQSSFR